MERSVLGCGCGTGSPIGENLKSLESKADFKLWLRNAEWSVRKRPVNRMAYRIGWPLGNLRWVWAVGGGGGRLLAHSAIGAFQLLLPLLALLALGLADNERTGADISGLVEIRIRCFGHDERILRKVDLNP
jgi:hypothetical protein